MTTPRRRRRRWIRWLVVAAVVVVAAGIATWWLDVAGVQGRAGRLAQRIELFIDPPPDRPIDEEVVVTPVPIDATTSPDAGPTASLAPGETLPPTPAPTPVPPRVAVDVDIITKPKQHFITEIDHEWCAVAATQMVLAMHDAAPLTEDFQVSLANRIGEWESRRDSRNGGWGPAAMVKAMEAYGVDGYEVRIYERRQDAMTDAARAIESTRAPAILLTWRGAHSWVMTGFKADADPLVFDDAQVTGTYILDPWYPRISSIWGASDPPGTFQDLPEMRRNYLPWERPEGLYPARDGRFVAVVPTKPLTP